METVPRDEVHLWTVLTDGDFDPRLVEQCGGLLSASEIERSDRYVFHKDRDQYLFSHALVRIVLSQYGRMDPQAWRFVENSFGKPALDPCGPFAGIRFNMTHTSGLVACAVCDGGDIGVDAENVEQAVDVDIARKFFSPTELEYLEQVPPEQKRSVFFELWTLKEAYIKARGLGLSIPLDTFAIRLSPPAAATILFFERSDDDPRNWQFFQVRPSPCHQLAICVRGSIRREWKLHQRRLAPFEIFGSTICDGNTSGD